MFATLNQISLLPDEEVISRVLDGETALYEIIMRRYNQRLYRIARTMLRDDDEAEDVMQDAYVRAYASLDQFAGKAKFSTWLTKIAVHEALSRLQKKKRTQPASAGTLSAAERSDKDGQTMDALRSSDPDPEQQTLRKETISFLEHAIDTLPENYRSVFVLRAVENLSTAETAACLTLTEETVKIRLLRSRKMVRRALYLRAGVNCAAAFAFLGQRCDRVVQRVFDRLAADNVRGQ